MELGFAAVAESLAYEFESVRSSTVIKVLTECVEEFPNNGPHFIEQAARARLLGYARPTLAPAWPSHSPDALDVSLHDNELAHEVELIAGLMVAANESSTRLAVEEIDLLLGVERVGRTAIPHQR